MEHIHQVRSTGVGPILVLPHLGGWEWAAAWLTQVADLKVSAVVEKLEPPELLDWFAQLRQAYDVEVIPLGTNAMARLVRSVKAADVVCLLADRDLAGNGVEVEFFGERTSLPVGPALLSRRTGAPLLPTAVYFRGSDHVAEVGKPIWPEWGSDLRTDLAEVTQQLAYHLERLIRAAPDQWHLLAPNWPSDLNLMA